MVDPATRAFPVALGQLEVQTPDAEALRLGDLVDRPTILAIPRYYGCLPCRDYLRRLAACVDEIDTAGGAVLAVSVGAAHQARWLADEQGVSFPLLIDPERRVYQALDLPRRWWVGLHPKGWWNYGRAIARGNRQGRIIEPNQLPGLALLDSSANGVWVHRGHALGDYPPIERVLARLAGQVAGDQRSTSRPSRSRRSTK